MRVRILGCGTSSGVPRIGNDWGQCDPADPKNRRTRPSILFESDGRRLLIDCGPDLRPQLLAAEVAKVEGVIVTHDHADHCHGIDDLRQMTANLGEPVPLYGRPETLEQLANRFSYIFEGAEFYRPTAKPLAVGDEIYWGNARLRFVDQPHGHIRSLGIRADGRAQSIAYAIDFHALTPAMALLYERAGLWICPCTSHQGHPTHAHLDLVLNWARDLKVGQLLLTHLDKSMDYATLIATLPDWAAPAYDGLEIEI